MHTDDLQKSIEALDVQPGEVRSPLGTWLYPKSQERLCEACNAVLAFLTAPPRDVHGFPHDPHLHGGYVTSCSRCEDPKWWLR